MRARRTTPICRARASRRKNGSTVRCVWRQEYEAEFTSLNSAALIDVTKLLQPDGSPWPEPERFDYLFVTVDSAIRTAGADRTAAVYCAIVGRIPSDLKLYFLDYDVVQVTAGVLERWFDAVVARARELIGERTMRAGPFYVEDASSGPILVEKYPSIVEALLHQWTMEGKDLRAYAVQQISTAVGSASQKPATRRPSSLRVCG